MFYGATSFNQNINNWDTSKVINMSSMFYNAASFNQDISGWNTSRVTNMSSMFCNATSFNQNIGNWDITNVSSITNIFTNAQLSTSTYSQFLISLSTKNSLRSLLNFGIITCYRYNDTVITNAYNYLTSVKVASIIDYGSIKRGDIVPTAQIPITKLDTSSNNTSITIPRSQRYTIITDSGGTDVNYKNAENYKMNVLFTNGVSLKINQNIKSGTDSLKIYKNNISGQVLYSSNADICNNSIDLSDVSNVLITFSSDSSITLDGFIILIETIPLVNSTICFIKDTPINTDQGIISIDKLTFNNTINNIKVKHVTETFTSNNYLVLLKKDSLFTNVPNNDTYMSMNHRVLFNGTMTRAKDLPNRILVPYNGEILYNVLLETYSHMIVNNMVVESLYPGNDVAKLYVEMESLTNELKGKKIMEFTNKLLH